MSEQPQSLTEALRSWPDDRLAALFAQRPDLLAPLPGDLSALASRSASPPSIARALDGLTLPQLQVVEALALLPEPATLEQLGKLLDGGDATGPLEDLEALALVWGGDSGIHLVPTVRQRLGDPAGLGQPAEELLRMRTIATVRTFALNLALTDPDAAEALTKDELLQVLGGFYADARALDQALSQVSLGAREVLDRLASGPPYGQIEDAARIVALADVRSPVDELLARGLLLAVDPGTVVLPREVGLRCRDGVSHPGFRIDLPDAELISATKSSVDRAAAGAAFALVRHVEEVLDRWGTEPPAALRTGGIGVRDLRRIATDLDTDEHGAALILEIAHAAGLVGMVGNTDRRWAPTEAYDDWLRHQPATRWSVLAEAWLSSPRLAGLAGERDDRDKLLAALGPDLTYPPAASPVRRALLGELAALPTGKGLRPDDLVTRLHWQAPRRAVQLGRRPLDWALTEAQLVGLVASGALSSPARELLAPDAGTVVAARAAAAEALAPLLPKPLDYVLLQADLTAIAPGPLVPELAAALALCADVESRGGATVYRFSETSMRRALDAGRSAADLHELLTGASRTPVPQPLSYLVDDVARRHGRVRVGAAGSYLRADDEGLLAELMADKRAVELGLRRLAPTVLISPLSPDDLLDALRSVNAAAVLEGAGGEVLLRRRDAVRAAARPRPARHSEEAQGPNTTLLSTAVRALRAGDRVRAAAPRGPTNGADGGDQASDGGLQLLRTTPAETLTLLREAAAEGASVWISYVNAEGRASVRLIEPIQVGGGFVSAYDHLGGEPRTFAVHRITGTTRHEGELLSDKPGDPAEA